MKPIVKKLLLLFCLAGLIAGTGAFVAQYISSADIASGIIAGLSALLITGGILALAGWGFSRGKIKKRGIALVYFFVLPLLGIALAFPTFSIADDLVTGNWQALQSAPEPVSGFISDDHASIYGSNLFLQAASGSTYVYECTNAVDCGWVQKEHTLVENPDAIPCNAEPAIKRVPALPGNVSASLDTVTCHVDGLEYTRFILLEDDSIYKWSDIQSFNDSVLRFFGFAFFGLLAGLAMSIAVLKMNKVSK